jgi:hypothetical protein
MNDAIAGSDETAIVWGLYPNYDDIARFEYGRRLWKLPNFRARFLQHWLDERHPGRERFMEQRALIEEVLDSTSHLPCWTRACASAAPACAVSRAKSRRCSVPSSNFTRNHRRPLSGTSS